MITSKPDESFQGFDITVFKIFLWGDTTTFLCCLRFISQVLDVYLVTFNKAWCHYFALRYAHSPCEIFMKSMTIPYSSKSLQ